ncbi:MAG: aminoacyl-tRNA hydrolase [Rhodobacterales bacterium]|nr:aminoacyl-tRNA hydrolase [Rhodobacterales bacterium]
MPDDLIINERITIPGCWFRVTFARSGGPGGQHVNTTDTKVHLFFDLNGCDVLHPAVKARMVAAKRSSMTTDGEFLVTSSNNRSRHMNLEAARQRIVDLVKAHLVPPKPRRATKPSRSAKRKRTDAKTQRGSLKKNRGRVKYDG